MTLSPKSAPKSCDSDLHACASQSAEGGLCAGARGLGLVSAGGAHLDVQGGDAQLLWATIYRQRRNNKP